MFSEQELQLFPDGLYFPPADEEAWLAFQRALAILRVESQPVEVRRPKQAGRIRRKSLKQRLAAPVI